MIDRSKFEQYAELKNKISQIELSLKALQPDILAMIEEAGQDVKVTGVGTFSRSERKTWTYSQFVQDSEKSLKERKKEEEKSGEATFEVTTVFPIFKAEKIDEHLETK